ncbi:MAG: acyl-CoA desaturase [Thermoleophilaceae bacterium]|nr:acyl-CoA desaturase [Thermoleophilaceae bacterium]
MAETAAALPAPTSADSEPVGSPVLDTVLTTFVTLVPVVGLVAAGWQLWGGALNWHDLVVLVATYIPAGLGISIGYHRLYTHRAFKANPIVRGVVGALGSAALEGPVISWVANHRKHHAFADRHGDPHSPHVDHGGGLLNTLRGLGHAHMGWLFSHTQRGAKARYAPDLLKDPVARFIDRTWVLWVALGLAFPFGLGVALTGTIAGGLTGLLWGGAVRIVLLHHATYSINSLCHVFGRRRFDTGDESRNLAWLAPLSFGEAWHNNHHAFPQSAAHGLGRGEFDLSAVIIRGLERTGLVWDVVRIPAERQLTKAV